MRKKPKISVVIPAFNEEKFLGKTLLSLKNQNFKDFEVIIVDNNSTDKTPKIARDFGAVLVFEQRQGVAFARQKGFLSAKAEIIATTDADAILPKNWLLKIWKEFKKDKNLIAFGGSCFFYSGPFFAILASKFLLRPFLILDKFFSKGTNLMGCNMAIKKEAFLKIGGFNLNLKLNEDVEISYRLRKVGKIKLDPAFKVMVSGRRFRHGFLFGIINYLPTTIYRWIFKRCDGFQVFFPERKEKSIIGNLSFVFTFFLFFFFFFFHFSNPKMVLAKNLIKKDWNKIIFIEKRIENKIKSGVLKLK